MNINSKEDGEKQGLTIGPYGMAALAGNMSGDNASTQEIKVLCISLCSGACQSDCSSQCSSACSSNCGEACAEQCSTSCSAACAEKCWSLCSGGGSADMEAISDVEDIVL